MKKLVILSVLLIASMTRIIAQTEVNLYPEGKIPNSKPTANKEEHIVTNGILRIGKISVPSYTVFTPANPSPKHAAIIIFPGGGYSITASQHEGIDFAKYLNEVGITAILIKYRIPSDSTMIDKSIGPLQDAQQAMLIVREHAAQWNIDTARIGIMGFSAGGHLASSLGTHYKDCLIPNPNKTSLRPDFMILGYPVISFQDSLAHMGSRNNLIGKQPSAEKIKYFSNELQVTKNTPPTFLVHASDDPGVKVANSVAFYQALVANHVKAEMHLYQNGGHGFGMKNKTTSDLWMERCLNWLRANDWL